MQPGSMAHYDFGIRRGLTWACAILARCTKRPALKAERLPVKKSEKAIADARDLAAKLKAEGRVPDVMIIERLCRSNVGLRETSSRLWADNMALRARGDGAARR